LIDEPETRENVIRDLEGIVLGKEYSHKEGQLIPKDKPSILKKIEFVKQIISSLAAKYSFDYLPITSFEGIVLTIDDPPISAYQGVRMLSIDDIYTLK
jgi:hypothetical protein